MSVHWRRLHPESEVLLSSWRALGRANSCRVGPGSFTPEPLTDPDLSLSTHPAHRAKAGAFRRTKGSSRRTSWPKSTAMTCPLRSNPHYRAFASTTRQSAPLRRIGTFGLAVGAACAFSLAIAGQVLTFRTGAWSSFAPPTCRMPLGQSQGIPRADPGGRVTPRF